MMRLATLASQVFEAKTCLCASLSAGPAARSAPKIFRIRETILGAAPPRVTHGWRVGVVDHIT